MFHTITEVNTAVFKYFSEKLSEDLGVLVRYARKSSADYTEEQPQQVYPCVAIQDYAPVPKDNWWIEQKPFHRATSTDGSTGYLYYLPLWMDFRYDISIASKSYKDHQRLQQWFIANTIAVDEITLDSFVVAGMESGEPIAITTRAQDVPRTDGVFETSYEITFSIWLYVHKPVGVEAVQEIALRFHRVSPSEVPIPDFNFDFNKDYAVKRGKIRTPYEAVQVSYDGRIWAFPTARLTDLIAQMLVTLEGYSGIRDITAEEYDSLAEKDPDMIYIIQENYIFA